MGATNHITNNNANLISPIPCTGFAKAASGSLIHIMARGQAIINVDRCKIYLNDVLHVPNASVNLILV